jgi:hypothetical protein
VNFNYTEWIFDTRLNYLGVVLPFDQMGTVGLSFYYFSSGDIEETTIYKPHGTGRVFDASDLCIGISYARQLTDRYSVGMTLKYISENLALENASTYAVDIGSVFIISHEHNLRMGFAISNFGPDMKMEGLDLETNVTTENSKLVEAQLKTMNWPLPLIFRVGLAADIIRNDNHRVTLAADVYDPRDYEARENFGMEYGFKSMFYLRGGYKFNYDEESFTTGFGFQYRVTGLGGLQFDYAYSDMGRLNQINRVSISLSF